MESPNRIDATFARLRARDEAAFIAYICAGDPTLEATRDLTLALAGAGVDILELGLPFSDPLADGVANQLAAQRALASGTTVRGVLDCIREIRATSQIPIVLYTYMNPIYAFGLEQFHDAALAAGVDGLLILDLPPEEPERLVASGMKQIRLIAPTTPPERMRKIANGADGFIYYVSREGVTGEQTSVPASLPERVAEIRRCTDLPIAVGFGVSKAEHARQIAAVADAVVVGSAIVGRIAEHGKDPELAAKIADFVRPLVAATKEKRH